MCERARRRRRDELFSRRVTQFIEYVTVILANNFDRVLVEHTHIHTHARDV